MKKFGAALALAICSVGSAYAAPLLGSSINYQYYFPNSGSPYGNADNGNKVVGAGVEVSNIADSMGTLDITANQIIVDFSRTSSWNGAGFNGWVLSDVFSSIDDFTSVVIDASSNMVGLTADRLSFTVDSISMNWQGLGFTDSTRVVLNVSTGGGNVPEPGTLALLGLALAGVSVLSRRT